MGERVLKLARVSFKIPTLSVDCRQRRQSTDKVGWVQLVCIILTLKTLAHASQAGMGRVLRGDVAYKTTGSPSHSSTQP
jgi:hypothetical protein